MTPIEPGTLPRAWEPPLLPGGCRADFCAHSYNADLVILRQSGQTHFEKPFLYLVFGDEAAMLVDTGAPGADVAGAVAQALKDREDLTGHRPRHLVVTHTHGHSDHVAGDRQFASRDATWLVAATTEAAREFFAIPAGPDGVGEVNLGGRTLDVIPVPGHDPTSIAFYDRRTGVLLSGDLLYPGRLYVRDATAFRESVRRLVRFTEERPVAHILGAHIENSRTPFLDYPEGTVIQPDEHELGLGRAHLLELHLALARIDADRPERVVLRDFTIWPVPPEQGA